MTPALLEACNHSLHLIRAEGTILSGGRAILFMLEQTGWGLLARLLAMPPSIWVIESGYKVVARNRIFFSRFLFRKE